MSFKLSKNYKKMAGNHMRKGDLYSSNINLELISE